MSLAFDEPKEVALRSSQTLPPTRTTSGKDLLILWNITMQNNQWDIRGDELLTKNGIELKSNSNNPGLLVLSHYFVRRSEMLETAPIVPS